MATGEEWRKYFEGKDTPYLRKQLKLIQNFYSKIDSKIRNEFNLVYMEQLKAWVIEDIIRERRMKK